MVGPIVLVVGTRAEAIKLIPVYSALKDAGLHAQLCTTYQHSDLIEQVFTVFDVVPDYNLNIMRAGQDLFHITTTVLERMREVYLAAKPSLVLVHGDTTTTMAASLAAFYLGVPIGHVEAGLRTGDMHAPFPEEMNRKVVGQIANYHFAPTAFSTANLMAEGVPRERVYCTGNTIVDALQAITAKMDAGEITVDPEVVERVAACRKAGKKMVLMTAHRRESFDGGLLRVFHAIRDFAQAHPDVEIFYPFHPNPNVLWALELSGIKEEPSIWTTTPLAYTELVYLLREVDWVATDSGGIQEEAVSLGKHVMVLRDITERWEGVWEGSEILVGTDEKKIADAMEQLYQASGGDVKPSTVYGDGRACATIVSIIRNVLSMPEHSPVTHRIATVPDSQGDRGIHGQGGRELG